MYELMTSFGNNVRVNDELWRMNYKKVQVMATAHDMFITYDDFTFLDLSVVDLD